MEEEGEQGEGFSHSQFIANIIVSRVPEEMFLLSQFPLFSCSISPIREANESFYWKGESHVVF